MQLPPASTLPSDTPPERGNQRTLFILIGVGAVAVILIAIGAFVLAGTLFSRPNSIPQLLAGDTQIYAAITPNLSDLPNIDRLRKAFPEVADYQNDTSFNDGMKESLGVTFNEDIAPWIGTEAAVAMSGLPLERMLSPKALASGNSADITNQVQIILILTTRDQKAAQAFLDKQRQYREGKGDQFTSSQANGTTIYAAATKPGATPTPLTAFAIVRGNVVFATSADLISAMAARDPNGKDTLAASPRFKQVLATIPADHIGFVFVDGAPLGKAFEANSDQFTAQLPKASAAQLRDQLKSMSALQGVGFSLSVLADGLAFDAMTVFDPAGLSQATRDQLKEAATPMSADRVGNVSADVITAISFRLPSTFGQQIHDSISNTPAAADQMAQIEQQFNLDLDRDLFSWLQGEATIVLLPGEDVAGTPAPVTGYIALKPNDRGAAEDGMGRIIKAFDKASEGQLGLHDEQIGGVTWQVLGPEGQIAGGYGFVGDDLVIGIGPSTLEAAAKPATALSTNVAYQAGLKALPSPNGGLIFVNLPAVVNLVKKQGVSDPKTTDRLAPFKAITAGGVPGMSDKGVTYGRLFLVISAK
jgi:hypothetical protein